MRLTENQENQIREGLVRSANMQADTVISGINTLISGFEDGSADADAIVSAMSSQLLDVMHGASEKIGQDVRAFTSDPENVKKVREEINERAKRMAED